MDMLNEVFFSNFLNKYAIHESYKMEGKWELY